MSRREHDLIVFNRHTGQIPVFIILIDTALECIPRGGGAVTPYILYGTDVPLE